MPSRWKTSGLSGSRRARRRARALLHEYPLQVGRRGPHFSGPSAGATLQGCSRRFIRRDDAGDLRQHPPAEFLASPRESTALGVGQAKWTWATLLPEDPILLPERIDHVFLVAVHPASGREYEEAQSVGHSLRLLGK